MFDDDFDYINHNFDEDYVEPESWTLISALDRVLNVVIDSKLSKKFWNKCKNPLDYLTKELNMTKMQVVILAILMEHGDAITWKGIAKYVKCTRLSIMAYSDEIEELVKRRWFFHSNIREYGSCYQGFRLASGVTKALRENKPFVPEKIDGLELDVFLHKVLKYVKCNVNSMNTELADDMEWMQMMCEANSHLPLCNEALRYKNDLNDLLLFMLIVCDYVEWGGTEDEGFNLDEMESLYPYYTLDDNKKYELQQGTHRFFEEGWIEHSCVDGMAETNRYVATDYLKNEILADFNPIDHSDKYVPKMNGVK